MKDYSYLVRLLLQPPGLACGTYHPQSYLPHERECIQQYVDSRHMKYGKCF